MLQGNQADIEQKLLTTDHVHKAVEALLKDVLPKEETVSWSSLGEYHKPFQESKIKPAEFKANLGAQVALLSPRSVPNWERGLQFFASALMFFCFTNMLEGEAGWAYVVCLAWLPTLMQSAYEHWQKPTLSENLTTDQKDSVKALAAEIVAKRKACEQKKFAQAHPHLQHAGKAAYGAWMCATTLPFVAYQQLMKLDEPAGRLLVIGSQQALSTARTVRVGASQITPTSAVWCVYMVATVLTRLSEFREANIGVKLMLLFVLSVLTKSLVFSPEFRKRRVKPEKKRRELKTKPLSVYTGEFLQCVHKKVFPVSLEVCSTFAFWGLVELAARYNFDCWGEEGRYLGASCLMQMGAMLAFPSIQEGEKPLVDEKKQEVGPAELRQPKGGAIISRVSSGEPDEKGAKRGNITYRYDEMPKPLVHPLQQRETAIWLSISFLIGIARFSGFTGSGPYDATVLVAHRAFTAFYLGKTLWNTWYPPEHKYEVAEHKHEIAEHKHEIAEHKHEIAEHKYEVTECKHSKSSRRRLTIDTGEGLKLTGHRLAPPPAATLLGSSDAQRGADNSGSSWSSLNEAETPPPSIFHQATPTFTRTDHDGGADKLAPNDYGMWKWVLSDAFVAACLFWLMKPLLAVTAFALSTYFLPVSATLLVLTAMVVILKNDVLYSNAYLGATIGLGLATFGVKCFYAFAASVTVAALGPFAPIALAVGFSLGAAIGYYLTKPAKPMRSVLGTTLSTLLGGDVADRRVVSSPAGVDKSRSGP